jgi:hypothetical protein
VISLSLSHFSCTTLFTIHCIIIALQIPKTLSQHLVTVGPVPVAGTLDSNQRSEVTRALGGSSHSSVVRDAFLSDEQTFSSSIRMVLDMSDRVTGAEFSLPTASGGGQFSARWFAESAVARWGAAGPSESVQSARRGDMSQVFFGNKAVVGLARGVRAVALTLHSVFKLVGITFLGVFDGDVLYSQTLDGIFCYLPISR